MPQSEYIKYVKENEGKVVQEYKPRLIKYTRENIKDLYQVDEHHLDLLFKDEYIGEGLVDIPLANASKVVDENGEPLLVYHF